LFRRTTLCQLLFVNLREREEWRIGMNRMIYLASATPASFAGYQDLLSTSRHSSVG
jgi:hypothetical protein